MILHLLGERLAAVEVAGDVELGHAAALGRCLSLCQSELAHTCAPYWGPASVCAAPDPPAPRLR
eukprot:1332826-Pyramimonas_sp.AAC.1